MEKEGSLHRLQVAWREVVQSLWQRRETIDGLTPEERRIVAILAEHPQYERYWRSADMVHRDANEEGVNPYLHAQIHAMVESQIALDHPREVCQALERLTRARVGRHEAIHRIGELLVRSIRPPGQGTHPFDHESYTASLKTLAP